MTGTQGNNPREIIAHAIASTCDDPLGRAFDLDDPNIYGEEADAIIAALAAAGFEIVGPGDWQWGYESGTFPGDVYERDSEEDAKRSANGAKVVRRRPAGEWQEVTP